jgi:hypothetical protein
VKKHLITMMMAMMHLSLSTLPAVLVKLNIP